MTDQEIISNEIKNRVDHIYEMIKLYEEELQKIRKNECPHIKTELVNYEWATGHIIPNTKVCSYCGKTM